MKNSRYIIRLDKKAIERQTLDRIVYKKYLKDKLKLNNEELKSYQKHPTMLDVIFTDRARYDEVKQFLNGLNVPFQSGLHDKRTVSNTHVIRLDSQTFPIEWLKSIDNMNEGGKHVIKRK